MATPRAEAPLEHRYVRHSRQLRRGLLWNAGESIGFVALGTASWMIAWWLWPDAIVIRLPPAILTLIAAFAFLHVLGAALGARGGGVWLFIMVGAYVAAIVYAAIYSGRLYRLQGWYAGVVTLLAWILTCAAMAFESARHLHRRAGEIREAKRRLEIDSRDGERPVRLVRAIEEARAKWNSFERDWPIVRVIYFGEPILEPRNVVVWALHSEATNDEWLMDRAGNTLADLFAGTLDMRLREIGYPRAIDVGVAPAAEVEAAGGDVAYFGEDGRRLAPQAPPRHAYWA